MLFYSLLKYFIIPRNCRDSNCKDSNIRLWGLLLRCHFHYTYRLDLLNDIYTLNPSLKSYSDNNLLNAPLYGAETFTSSMNKEILICVISFFKKSCLFSGPRSCSWTNIVFMLNNVQNLHKAVCDLFKMSVLFCSVLILFFIFFIFIFVNNFLSSEYSTLYHDRKKRIVKFYKPYQ